MREDIKDFVDALESYVKAQLQASGEPADYNVEALEIVDARNHLFRHAGKRVTDESENIYALRDLCRVDEMSLDFARPPTHGGHRQKFLLEQLKQKRPSNPTRPSTH